MADPKTPELSEKTKALLERTRAQKDAEGTKTATVIEDAKPVKVAKAPTPPAPPVDNAFVEEGAEQFTPETTRIANNVTDNEPAASNDELKVKTRTMSRTEAEQERGRQIIQKNKEARRRAEAAQRKSDEDNE